MNEPGKTLSFKKIACLSPYFECSPFFYKKVEKEMDTIGTMVQLGKKPREKVWNGLPPEFIMACDVNCLFHWIVKY